MSEILAVDIGGTHVRFAIAQVRGGRVVELGAECTLEAAAHSSFESAWDTYEVGAARPLPGAAAIALAGPVEGEVLQLTNNPWLIRPSLLRERLGGGRVLIVNDFAAVAHAVAQLGPEHFSRLCGPDRPLPTAGVTSIVGPGTGLGAAQLIRRGDGYQVIPTEGGHIDFAPLDPLEDRILVGLRERHGRVSAERIASGPGLANIYEALASMEAHPSGYGDEKALWRAATGGADSLAAAALDRFCLVLGAVAGDIALAQGAGGVAIAGGLGLRLANHLPGSGFHSRFIAKGRFQRRMEEMPVRLVMHPQPGLFGAAAAFAAQYSD